MPAGLPDWFKSVRLTGKYGLQLIPVAVDENGNLYAVIKGTDGTTLRTVKLDVDGSILAKLVGGTIDTANVSGAVDIGSVADKERVVSGSVDVGTVNDKDRNVKGYDGAAYKPIAVDADGIMLARLKGFDGSQLRDVLVDADGQIITVLRGKNGNYVLVDENGYLTSILKGADRSGNLRNLLVDEEGRIEGTFKGRYTNPFDLVLDLPFDEGEGSVAYDQSLYGNNGTIYGATWTRGRSGWALSFDGVDDRVEVPHSDELNIAEGNKITITMWAYLTGWQEGYPAGVVIDKRTENQANYNWEFNENVMSMRVHAEGTIYSACVPHSFNTWNFYAMVLDGDVLKGYLNGELKATVTGVATSGTNTVDLHIGETAEGVCRTKGIIDEVRIYSRALTDEEIRELYEGRPTLRVDRNGNLSALLYGKLGNVFKPVELDSLSNLKINISSQELDRIIQRASLGWCKSATPSGTVAAGGEVDAFSVSGAGYFIYAFLQFNNAAMKFSFIFDDATEYWELSINQMKNYGFKASTPFMGILEPTVPVYTAYVAPPMPLSFENSFKIRLKNPTSSNIDYVLGVYYAVL